MIYKGKTRLFEIHLNESTGLFVLFEPYSCKYHKPDKINFESYEAAECYAQEYESKLEN